MRFCGSSWDTATCSIESHCPTGLECKNGEICFTKEGCNAFDLTMTPTIQPSLYPTLPRNHTSYFKFCGRTVANAAKNCTIDTHCGFVDNCPAGTLCLDVSSEQCDAFAMLHPELVPLTTMAPQSSPKVESLSPSTASPVTTAPIIHDDVSLIFEHYIQHT